VPLYFWHWNFNSALLEVALCIMAYIVVLWIELSPAFFEKFSNDSQHLALRRLSRAALPVLEKSSVWIVALGLLLPTMHQSSLGTLMLLANWRLHPLWNSPLVPSIFLLSCLSMGYAVVVFESAFSAIALKRPPETKMLASLAAAIVPVQIVVVVMRTADIFVRGQAGLLFAWEVRSALVWLEIVLLAAPVVMLFSDENRHNLAGLVRAAMVMMFAGALYRFDVYLVAFTPGEHWSYFPSVPELLVSVGLVALEIVAYIFIVKTFPILAGAPRRPAERQAA
jgi:Ni/Fe-hydrogenase subunit HybB-like protein